MEVTISFSLSVWTWEPFKSGGSWHINLKRLWREKCHWFFVFLQISLSLKLLITSWSLSRFSECCFVYYVYCCTYSVISSTPAALFVLVLRTEIFDMNQDAKVGQKTLCMCVYTLKIHTWMCMTIWYTVPGQFFWAVWWNRKQSLLLFKMSWKWRCEYLISCFVLML